MGIEVSCAICGKRENVIPARAKKYRFCSYACAGVWRRENFRGEGNPTWQGGERERTCEYCGKQFSWDGLRANSVFQKQKFCSKPCADAGGFRYSGPNHPLWKGKPRRRGNHRIFVDKILARDNHTCQTCGSTGPRLHAHHILSYKDHPDKRDDPSNGITLCEPCHWDAHSKELATSANGVNSGEAAAGRAGGNPEPSQQRKLPEGATTSERAYRRVSTQCSWCEKPISRRLSDATGKRHLYCDKICRGKHWSVLKRANGSNSRHERPARKG